MNYSEQRQRLEFIGDCEGYSAKTAILLEDFIVSATTFGFAGRFQDFRFHRIVGAVTGKVVKDVRDICGNMGKVVIGGLRCG